MKKFVIVILITVFSITLNSANNVSAIGVTTFEVDNLSPRFQYLKNSSGELIEFEIEVTDNIEVDEDIPSIRLKLDQVNSDGSFIKTLKYFDSDYDFYNSSIVSTNLDFTAGEVAGFDERYDLSNSNLGKRLHRIDSVLINNVPAPTSSWTYNSDTGEFIILDNYIQAGNSIRVNYTFEQSDVIITEFSYDWSGLEFGNDNLVFYRLSYQNIYLWTGAVMKTPRTTMTTETTNYGIEIGDFLVEGSGTPDHTNFHDFNYNINEDYLVLHYNMPTINPQLDYETVFRFIDIESNTIEESFDVGDIFAYQGGYLGDFKDSFVVIPLDGEMIPALQTGYEYINDLYMDTTFTTGSYLPVMVFQPTSYSLIDYASTVINIVDDDIHPFKLDLRSSNISLDDVQRATFRVNNEIISPAYTTTLAKDNGVNEDYSDTINSTIYTYSVGYKPLDSLLEGDVVGVQWVLEPAFLPFSIDTSEFAVTLTSSYTISDDLTDVTGSINNWLVYYGMGDELGQTFFTIIVILLANVGLALWLKARAFIVYGITNSALLLIFSVLGFAPMWLLIGVGILIMISVIISVTSSMGGDEL